MKKIDNISKVSNLKLLKSIYKGFLALSLATTLGACSDNEDKKNVYIADGITLSNAIDMVSEYSLVDEILENRNFTLNIGNLYTMESRYMENRKNLELYYNTNDKYRYISFCNNDLENIGLYLLKAKIVEALGLDVDTIESVTINPNDTCRVSYKEEYKKKLNDNAFIIGSETITKEYRLKGVNDLIDVILEAQIGDFTLNYDIDNNYKEIMKVLCKMGKVDGKKIIFTYSDELIDIIENKKVKTLTK